MKIKTLITLFSILISLVCQAQRKVEQIDPEKEATQVNEEKKKEQERATGPKWYENVSFGGNIGGGFSTYGSFFMVQPMAFYRVTEMTMAGLGISYYYWSQSFKTYSGTTYSVSDHAYGLNLFARQTLFDPVFAHVELMPLNFQVFNQNTGELNREWVNALYIGGGINQQISDRSAFYLVILYDVLFNATKNFRGTPLDIRTGFYF